MNNKCKEGTKYVVIHPQRIPVQYLPALIPKTIQNMEVTLEWEGAATKAGGKMHRVSANNMNHVKQKFGFS